MFVVYMYVTVRPLKGLRNLAMLPLRAQHSRFATCDANMTGVVVGGALSEVCQSVLRALPYVGLVWAYDSYVSLELAAAYARVAQFAPELWCFAQKKDNCFASISLASRRHRQIASRHRRSQIRAAARLT